MSIEERVSRSTPAIISTPAEMRFSEVKSVSCGEKHLMLLCSDGVSPYSHTSPQAAYCKCIYICGK